MADVDNFLYFYRGESLPEAIERIFEGYDRFMENIDHFRLENPAIAGGACRSWVLGEKPRDFDIYLTRNKDREAIVTDDAGENAPVIRLSSFTTNGGAIEVINYTYRDLAAILLTFDMTVAMCAVDKEQLVCHEDYLSDLASKSIRFTNLGKPMNSLLRLQKYVKYGFTAHPRELTQLATAFYMMSEEPKMPDFARDPVTGHFVINYTTGKGTVNIPF